MSDIRSISTISTGDASFELACIDADLLSILTEDFDVNDMALTSTQLLNMNTQELLPAGPRVTCSTPGGPVTVTELVSKATDYSSIHSDSMLLPVERKPLSTIDEREISGPRVTCSTPGGPVTVTELVSKATDYSSIHSDSMLLPVEKRTLSTNDEREISGEIDDGGSDDWKKLFRYGGGMLLLSSIVTAVVLYLNKSKILDKIHAHIHGSVVVPLRANGSQQNGKTNNTKDTQEVNKRCK